MSYLQHSSTPSKQHSQQQRKFQNPQQQDQTKPISNQQQELHFFDNQQFQNLSTSRLSKSSTKSFTSKFEGLRESSQKRLQEEMRQHEQRQQLQQQHEEEEEKAKQQQEEKKSSPYYFMQINQNIQYLRNLRDLLQKQSEYYQIFSQLNQIYIIVKKKPEYCLKPEFQEGGLIELGRGVKFLQINPKIKLAYFQYRDQFYYHIHDPQQVSSKQFNISSNSQFAFIDDKNDDNNDLDFDSKLSNIQQVIIKLDFINRQDECNSLAYIEKIYKYRNKYTPFCPACQYEPMKNNNAEDQIDVKPDVEFISRFGLFISQQDPIQTTSKLQKNVLPLFQQENLLLCKNELNQKPWTSMYFCSGLESYNAQILYLILKSPLFENKNIANHLELTKIQNSGWLDQSKNFKQPQIRSICLQPTAAHVSSRGGMGKTSLFRINQDAIHQTFLANLRFFETDFPFQEYDGEGIGNFDDVILSKKLYDYILSSCGEVPGSLKQNKKNQSVLVPMRMHLFLSNKTPHEFFESTIMNTYENWSQKLWDSFYQPYYRRVLIRQVSDVKQSNECDSFIEYNDLKLFRESSQNQNQNRNLNRQSLNQQDGQFEEFQEEVEENSSNQQENCNIERLGQFQYKPPQNFQQSNIVQHFHSQSQSQLQQKGLRDGDTMMMIEEFDFEKQKTIESKITEGTQLNKDESIFKEYLKQFPDFQKNKSSDDPNSIEQIVEDVLTFFRVGINTSLVVKDYIVFKKGFDGIAQDPNLLFKSYIHYFWGACDNDQIEIIPLFDRILSHWTKFKILPFPDLLLFLNKISDNSIYKKKKGCCFLYLMEIQFQLGLILQYEITKGPPLNPQNIIKFYNIAQSASENNLLHFNNNALFLLKSFKNTDDPDINEKQQQKNVFGDVNFQILTCYWLFQTFYVFQKELAIDQENLCLITQLIHEYYDDDDTNDYEQFDVQFLFGQNPQSFLQYVFFKSLKIIKSDKKELSTKYKNQFVDILFKCLPIVTNIQFDQPQPQRSWLEFVSKELFKPPLDLIFQKFNGESLSQSQQRLETKQNEINKPFIDMIRKKQLTSDEIQKFLFDHKNLRNDFLQIYNSFQKNNTNSSQYAPRGQKRRFYGVEKYNFEQCDNVPDLDDKRPDQSKQPNQFKQINYKSYDLDD